VILCIVDYIKWRYQVLAWQKGEADFRGFERSQLNWGRWSCLQKRTSCILTGTKQSGDRWKSSCRIKVIELYALANATKRSIWWSDKRD
jgi:hypothetical protein